MSIRVLVTEPDFELAETYEAFLTRKGFEVLIAANGQQCIDCLRDGTSDVLILETDLPDGCASEIQHSMRDHSDSTPVVIVTRRESSVGLLPAKAIFVKPVAMQELCQTIKIVVVSTKTKSN